MAKSLTEFSTSVPEASTPISTALEFLRKTTMNAPLRSNPNDLILSRDEVRAIDAAAIKTLGIPGLMMMENAARSTAQQLPDLDPSRLVTILCGPGNNGGDGLAVARQRAAGGSSSRVFLETAGKPLSTDTRSNLEFLTNSGVNVQILNDSSDCGKLLADMAPDDWIVDGLLGTGVHGELRSPFSLWVEAINASPAQVLSIDVPSGLNCDDGSCGNQCVQANVTVSFVGMKRGFLTPSAAKYTGRIVIGHIGIPLAWIHDWLIRYRETES
ncbi:MAG: NAD(P)H-hydrate epimerase [Fuerstiella sp.]|nr:NAD(P)H-hydrate epimerase [Fuerstiella sp.]